MKLLNVSVWYFYSTIVRMGDFHPHHSNSLTSILILKYDFWVLCHNTTYKLCYYSLGACKHSKSSCSGFSHSINSSSSS